MCVCSHILRACFIVLKRSKSKWISGIQKMLNACLRLVKAASHSSHLQCLLSNCCADLSHRRLSTPIQSVHLFSVVIRSWHPDLYFPWSLSPVSIGRSLRDADIGNTYCYLKLQLPLDGLYRAYEMLYLNLYLLFREFICAIFFFFFAVMDTVPLP